MRRAFTLLGVVVLSLATQSSPVAQTLGETELLQRLSAQPSEIANYLELVKLYTNARRFDDAEQMLTQAMGVLRRARIAPIPPQAAAGVSGGFVGGVPAGVAGGTTTSSQRRELLGPGIDAPLRIGGDIKEPKKLKNVPPIYPIEAQAAKIQGIVIIEAIIAKDGTVRDARILRSIPVLDEAAITAVRQWEFTPTFLNGVPVEVVMTVTVNFTLS